MLPWQHFCQGGLGQKFQLFVKNGIFLLQNVISSDFWLEFEINASELTPVPNFSSIWQKIRELEFWPGTIPKTAWWRHTYLLVMTSAKFLCPAWIGLKGHGFHGDKATVLSLTLKYYSLCVLYEKFYCLQIGPVNQKVWPFKCMMLKTLNSNFLFWLRRHLNIL